MPSEPVVIPDDFKMPVGSFDIPHAYRDELKTVIITEGMIKDRVRKMAQDINGEIGDEPLALLCVLKGSYRFFPLLADELTLARSQKCANPMTVDFIRCSSYEDTQSTGTVKITGLDNISSLKDKHVLIVEDVVESGLTLHRLLQKINELCAKKCWTALLVSKRVKRTVDVAEDFVAFEVPDRYIVGFGFDYNQRYREMPHICYLTDEGKEKFRVGSK